ncbi:MAG: lytic transglycosylase domain-containing protein [bacterium]
MNRKKFKFTSYLILSGVFALAIYFIVPNFLADEVYPLKYTDLIKKYSTQYDVDPALVAAVIMQESRFNPRAVSPVGAQGLMQFMPSTAAMMAKETGHWPKYDIYDPETSIEFGSAHLRDLLADYEGNLDKALAGYNAGSGTVDNWVRQNIFEKLIGSNSKSETINYVRKVKNYQTIYSQMYGTELGIASPVQLQNTKVDNSQIRGYIWTQIFSNFSGIFEGK